MHIEAADSATALLDALDDALIRVRRATQSPEYRSRLLASLDVPGGPGSLRALRAVERSDQEAPFIGEVASTLGLDPSTASRVVDRCVVAGLLARESHPGDRRRSHLRLTPEGKEFLATATQNRRGLLIEVTRDWPAEDLERLVGLLHELIEGFGRLGADRS